MDDDLHTVEKDDLILDVERGPSKAAYLWPAKRRPGDHNPQRMVAGAVVEHLERCGR